MDFDKLQEILTANFLDREANPIKYNKDLVDDIAQEIHRSPVIAMKWMSDNYRYEWQTFVELSASEGWQGVRAFNKKGKLHKEIKVPLGGGEASEVGDQIYINNKRITNAVLDFVSGERGFKKLEKRIHKEVSEGKTNPMGFTGGSLEGVPLMKAGVFRSPCGALQWMNDNTDYTFKTFVELAYDKGEQGLLVYQDGELIKRIAVPMGGGDNHDPNKVIYENNKRILMITLGFIEER